MAVDLDYLLFSLNSTKSSERKKAVAEIEKSGSTEAGKYLIPILSKDRDESIRAGAARALGTLGIREAAPALIAAIKAGSEEVSYFAAGALARIASNEVIMAVSEEMARSDESGERSFYWLTQALARMGGDGISAIVDQLSTRSWPRRRILGDALMAFGHEAEKYLITGLSEDNADKRFWCATVLGRVGGDDAVSALVRFVDDESNDVRTAVITSLGEIGSKKAIEFLKKALKSPKKELRHKSVEVLGKFGDEIIEPLIESLSDDYWYVRDSACQALARLGKKAIPHLASSYDTGSEDIRFSAVKALAGMGEDAAGVLIHALGDRYEPICRKAADALVKIGPFAIDPLMAVFKKSGETESVRRWAIYALGEICRSHPNPAVANLVIEALKSHELMVRFTAVGALGAFRSGRVINSLISLLADIHEEVREKASENLVEMSKDSLPFLLEALGHDSWIIRKNVAAVIGKIGKDAIPKLLKVLQGNDDNARYWAIKAMGHIGAEAVEPLLQFLNDSSWQVRKNAADALAEIGEPVIKPLTAKLTKSKDEYGSNLFYWAESVLARIGSPALHSLMSLMHHTDENIRLLAISVIGKVHKSPETYQFVRDIILEDESFEVRKKAARWLGYYKVPEVVDILTEFYSKNEDAEETLAPIIIDSVALIDSKKTVDFLHKMLRSMRWVSRHRAVCALANLSEKSYLEVDLDRVIALLTDEVQVVAESAARFLSSNRNEKAQITVVRLLKEKKFEAVILETLARNPAFKSRDTIVPYLRSEDKRLRASAALALGLTGTKGNIASLTALLNDEFIGVRTAALYAINQINARNLDEKGAPDQKKAQEKREADPNAIDEPIMTDAEKHYQMGLFHAKNGDYEKAIHAYQSAISSDPGFVMAYCKVGLILEEKGYYEKAAAFFRKAVEVAPSFAPAHLYLGIVYGMLGKPYEAVTALRSVIKLAPQSDTARTAQKIIDQIKKNIPGGENGKD